MEKLSEEQRQELYQGFESEIRLYISKLSNDIYFIDPYDVICAMDLLEDSYNLIGSYNVDLSIKLADLVIQHCEEYSNFEISKNKINGNLFFIKQIRLNKDDFINDMNNFKKKLLS